MEALMGLAVSLVGAMTVMMTSMMMMSVMAQVAAPTSPAASCRVAEADGEVKVVIVGSGRVAPVLRGYLGDDVLVIVPPDALPRVARAEGACRIVDGSVEVWGECTLTYDIGMQLERVTVNC